jgi:hypothetical protein
VTAWLAGAWRWLVGAGDRDDDHDEWPDDLRGAGDYDYPRSTPVIEAAPEPQTQLATYRERLLAIRDAVQAAPDGRVDLAHWRDRRDVRGCGTDPDEDPPDVSNEELVTSPRAVGCAIGWACASPDLWRLGLTWDENGPAFAGVDGWDAVCKFTGLDEHEARVVFADHGPELSRGVFALVVRANDADAQDDRDRASYRLSNLIGHVIGPAPAA